MSTLAHGDEPAIAAIMRMAPVIPVLTIDARPMRPGAWAAFLYIVQVFAVQILPAGLRKLLYRETTS